MRILPALTALGLSACNPFVVDDSWTRCKSDEQCERWDASRPRCLFGSCQECGRSSDCRPGKLCDRGRCCVTECAVGDDARAIAGCYAVDAPAALPCGAAVLPPSIELRLDRVAERDGCLRECAFTVFPPLIATGQQRGAWNVRDKKVFVDASSGYSGVAISLTDDADRDELRGVALPFLNADIGHCYGVDVVLTRVPCPEDSGGQGQGRSATSTKTSTSVNDGRTVAPQETVTGARRAPNLLKSTTRAGRQLRVVTKETEDAWLEEFRTSVRKQ